MIKNNLKINASNELLKKKQEFCFGIKGKKKKKKRKEKMKEFMTCIYMGKHHTPFSPAFFFSFILLFLYQLSHGWIFFLSFLFLISSLISIPWILFLCLSTEIRAPSSLTIQIKNSFSLAFVLWFTHSCCSW